MNLTITREEKLFKILEGLEFGYIEKEKYELLSVNYFNDTNDIAILSSNDINDESDKLYDDYFFVIYDATGNYNSDNIIKKLREKIQTDLNNSSKCQTVTVICIFSSIDQAFSKNEIINIRKEVFEELKKKLKTILLRNIGYEWYVIPKKIDKNQIIQIQIEDRIRSLEQKYDLKVETSKFIEGYVFTAKVDSILKLYKIFGDDLFDRNVRVGGIADYMGVDNAIKDTYQNSPDDFWFFNNGISILIESNKELDLNLFNYIRFSINDLKDISVINGAQTIRAANDANILVNKNSKCLQKETGTNDANVLLRVYFYKNDLPESSSGNADQVALRKFRTFSEKVTIALNKQKPIRQTDLAYMTNFVKNIQELRLNLSDDPDNKDYTFNFVRRGELSSLCACQYQLDIFAKVVRAYLQNCPGTARSMSYATLLRLKASTDDSDKTIPELNEEGIFIPSLQKPWNYEEADDYINEFKRNYRPVNFAMKLKKYLEEKSDREPKKTNFQYITSKFYTPDLIKENEQDKSIKIDEQDKEYLDAFANYGTLYMMAAVVHYLNEHEVDYSNWKYTGLTSENNDDLNKNNQKNLLSIEKLEIVMYKVLKYFLKYEPDSNDDVVKSDLKESNFWKRDILAKYLNKLKD